MDKKKNGTLWSMLGYAWEIGYMIAIPLIGFAFLGRFIDKKLATSPLFLLLGIGLAIIISTVIVVRKTKEALEQAENDQENEPKT
ncbi:AtpZ/AtpI family protein [Candidatus Uhrbacteria bacterium]|nr:AtpZ/AtpI family protein [Candidatus Uhrbacteria bacterium]